MVGDKTVLTLRISSLSALQIENVTKSNLLRRGRPAPQIVKYGK